MDWKTGIIKTLSSYLNSKELLNMSLINGNTPKRNFEDF